MWYSNTMTFVLQAVRDRPVFLFAMDDTSPFQDYSGYNQTGVAVGGTPTPHISLAAGVTSAKVLTSAITAAYISPVFKQGRENAPFSLEAWFRVIPSDTPTEQQVLGHLNEMDGLTVNGNKVSFRVKFLTAPAAVITYDVQQGQTIHAVAVKTTSKMSLYVQGALVKELTLTEAQQADDYVASDGNLYSGATTGSQKIAIGPIAGYATTLDKDAVNRHWNSGTATPSTDDVIGGFAGEHIPVSLSNANLFLDQWWTTEEQWKAAELSNVTIVDGQLQPLFDGDTSVPGQWLDSFTLGTVDEGTTIHGVSMNWDGTGMTVEASLDGTSWELVKRGINLSIIPPGFDPNQKELQLRVKFPGGIVDDESFLDNLNVIGIKNNVAPKVAGRTITFTNAYQERDYPPLRLHDNWGAEVGTGGSIVIGADADESVPARTVEVWLRRASSTPITFSFSTSNLYYDGVAGSGNTPIGQWVLVHAVATANITGPITIGGASQIGAVGIYDTVLSATDVAKIYAQYTRTEPLKVDDSDTIMVSESAIPVKIYAHDWTIDAAG